MKTLIKNSRVITPYEIRENCSLCILDSKIVDLVKADQVDEAQFDKVIDLEGKYLSPGFIDVHNHGNYGHDAMEGTAEALASMSKFHLSNGVTGYLATTMTGSQQGTIKAIKNAANYIRVNSEGAKVLGLYLEGPYFAQEKKGAQPPEFIKDPDLDELKIFLQAGEGNVKIVALAPELSQAKEAVALLKERGVTVAAGHTNAAYTEASEGIERGITQATHLYNGMRAFTHREPGVIGAVLTDERVACEMICDGIHLHPAAMKVAVKLKGKDKIILISDAMMATGLKDGTYDLGGQDVFVKDGVARLKDGALAGSTLTLNRAVYNMVHLVGVPLQEAVQMATLNPARAIGADKNKGSIEIGKDADLIAFDEKLAISFAMIEGEVK